MVTNLSHSLIERSRRFRDLLKLIECVIVQLPTGIAVVIQSFTLFGRGLEPEPVYVVHWLFVGIGGSDDFHVRAAPLFRDEDVCAVAGGFDFPLDNFVAFDFVPIHHLCLYIIPT